MAQFQRFPMWMRHPCEQAAVVSSDEQVLPNGQRVWVDAQPGKPLRFPPVMVQNEDQEEYHKAQGYVPANGNPTAFIKATVAPDPPGYQHHEYPRMVNGRVEQGPNAPKPLDNRYPMWVRMAGYPEVLVDDEEEHNALLAARGVKKDERPVSDAEAECVAAILAAAESQDPDFPRIAPEVNAVVTKLGDTPKRRGRPPKNGGAVAP